MDTDSPTRDYMDNSFEESPESRPMLTMSDLAFLSGTSPAVIERLVEWDIVVPSGKEPEPLFPLETLPRVRWLLRIHAGLGIDFPSLPLVLDLLERIAGLEQRLADLESRHNI